MYRGLKITLTFLLIVLIIRLTVSYLLPVFFPFLLGALLALSAEPMTAFLCARLKLPRGAAAGIGVTAAFCLLAILILLLCGMILREVTALTALLPDLEAVLSEGLSSLDHWAMGLAARMPGSIGRLLESGVREFFSGSSRFLEQAYRFALGLTGGVLRRVPNGALVLGTAVISSYMISARLPKIREYLRNRIPHQRLRAFLESVKRLKTVLLGWLKAQFKLMGITWLILTLGLVLLRIPHAPLWAGAVALVDAFPILGTGTVLLPWALVSFLQADTARAVGLLGVYAAVSLTRSILEPKLLGSQLGLDPLVTLAALYAGFRLWGFGGMLLAPLLAVTAVQLLQKPNPGS